MSKSVVFSQCGRIACAGQSSPAVILCLDESSLLANNTCERTTLEGVLTNVYKDTNCGVNTAWRYVISYDENLLADPTVALVSTDITGIFCKSCLTSWVEDEILCAAELVQEPLLVEDTDSIDLTIGLTIPQTLSADVNISADVDNALVLHADGLYVETSTGTTITVDDTDSVNLTLASDVLTADVNISADADNVLVLHADGLYVEATTGGITTDDTASVSLTVVADVLTANVNISADADNIAVIHADGLYVPATDLSVLNAALDLSLFGWITFDLSAATYSSAFSFTLTGDYTSVFTKGTPLRLMNSGTKYGNVLTSVFSVGVTTVTLVDNNDFPLVAGVITDLQISRGNPADFPDWFTYNMAPTGFAGVPFDLQTVYRLDGKEATVSVFMTTGTSTLSTTSGTLPVPAGILAGTWTGIIQAVTDGGVTSTNVGLYVILAGASVVDFFPTQLGGGFTWTASGNKGFWATITYGI